MISFKALSSCNKASNGQMQQERYDIAFVAYSNSSAPVKRLDDS